MALAPHREYPAEVVRGTFFEHDVPLDKMFVHFRTLPDGYARPLSVRRLNKLIVEFDRQALGVALLSMRDDGSFAIIDAQHRWEACKFKGLKTMDAMVYIDLSLEDEARLYRKFGDYLKQTPLDKYHAALAERAPEYTFIQRTLSDRSLYVPIMPTDVPNSIVAVDAMLRVNKTLGPDIFTETIDLLHNAWQGEHRAYRGPLIQGTAAFLARYRTNPNYNPGRLISRMQAQGMSIIERRARLISDAALGSDANSAWGQALLAVHDKSIHEDRQLGQWSRRYMAEDKARAAAQNLREISAAMTPEQRSANSFKGNAKLTSAERSARAIKGILTRGGVAFRNIACPFCNAMVSDPCITTSGTVKHSYHRQRREAYALNYGQKAATKA